jgi:polar amino acid transport system substrate-binding protein/glutamate/aspartate transport system substrate-binding protein
LARLLLLLVALASPGRAAEPLQLGYLEDSLPFSASSPQGPHGFAVELCASVAAAMDRPPAFTGFTLSEGLDAVAEGQIALLCGSQSATIGRRATVDFSIPIFLGGAGIVVRSDAPAGLRRFLLQGAGIGPARSLLLGIGGQRRIGVLAGSTTEDLLDAALERWQVGFTKRTVERHDEGFAALARGELEAYAAEGAVLLYRLDRGLEIADRWISREPIALAVARGDAELRLAVDAALSRLYRDPAFDVLARRWFGREAGTVAAQLRALALPE